MTTIIRQFSNFYGDLRGYGRGRIRSEVARSCLMSVDELTLLTETLFQRRVRAALDRFPSYADCVRKHCGGLPETGRRIVPADLPVWTRQDQRTLFSSLPGAPVPGAFVHATGGSTGEPTRFYATRESYEWRTAVADRGYSWAGAEEGRKSYYVWGSPIKPLPVLRRLKVDLEHMIQRRRYFDSFLFNEARKRSCCHEINRFQPGALVGYAGNLVDLALYVRAHAGVLRWKAHSLVTGAEGLQPGQRELLEETLADEVFMSYGSREFMLIGMECPQHLGYHVSADNLFVEVVDESGQPVVPGQTGRILVTDLRNEANPFVRYEIGDLGAWASESCSCGLPFPLLSRVEGRIQEALLAADGARMTALFIPHLMKEFSWVRGYQLEQQRAGALRVNILSDHDLLESAVADLVAALQTKLGQGTQVEVVRVPALRKSASGKVPIVIT